MHLKRLEHKAAGHDGPLQSADGSLFIKPTNSQEIEFYNVTQGRRLQASSDIPYGDQLADWMPEYIGALFPGASDDLIMKSDAVIDEETLLKAADTAEIEKDKKYIVLSNCLHGFVNPCILDIKLGSVLFDESASPDKVERMKKVSKSTTSGSLGFRIAGMIIKNDFGNSLPPNIENIQMKDVCSADEDGEYLTFDKYFGRKLTAANVQQGLEIFFKYNKLPDHLQNQIIKTFHARLQMLYNCLLDEEIRVISGSLFFIFENSLERWESSNFEDPILNPPTIFDEDEDEDEYEYEDEYEDEDDNGNFKEGNVMHHQKAKDYPSKSTRPPLLSSLKLIDFAHAKYTPKMGYDEEIVTGIENLFNILEHMV